MFYKGLTNTNYKYPRNRYDNNYTTLVGYQQKRIFQRLFKDLFRIKKTRIRAISSTRITDSIFNDTCHLLNCYVEDEIPMT
jgi:hypothetical protein